MTQKEIVLKSRRVVLPEGEKPAAVVIETDKITKVIEWADASAAEDLGDMAILPGIVDAHVHINEPGRTEWEGFETATDAAAAGGITTLIDMPLNSSPVTTSVEALGKKISATKGKLRVDCGFYAGVIPGSVDEIEKLAKAGVMGFKVFLVHSGIDEFPNVSESDLREAMPRIAKTGLPLLVHAELTQDTDGSRLEGQMTGAGFDDWTNSRPQEMEIAAIKLIAALSREYRCRCHIVHLAASRALDFLREARENNPLISVETCPHYLFFSNKSADKKSTLYKCAPPIRDSANREALWDGLNAGVIDFIASDHSPSEPSLKLIDSGDFKKAWGGIASLQFMLPALWTGAKARGFQLADLGRWLSKNPADFLGLKNKGRIASGFDADLVVFDPEASFSPTSEEIKFRHKISPYVGQTLQGRVRRTYLRGRKIYDIWEGFFERSGLPLITTI